MGFNDDPNESGHGWRLDLNPSTEFTVVGDMRLWDGIDIDASLAKLDTLTVARIQEQFPGMEISLNSSRRIKAMDAYELVDEIEDYDRSLTDEMIEWVATEIGVEVFIDGALWMVEKE